MHTRVSRNRRIVVSDGGHGSGVDRQLQDIPHVQSVRRGGRNPDVSMPSLMRAFR